MRKFDPVWLDSQYNNRARVPDHARHLQQWASASADARAAHPHTADIAYGDAPLEKLDVFLPNPVAPTHKKGVPVVVFVHGGYWRSLDKSDHSFIAPAFTNQGACVVVPNYSLCPAVTLPEIVMQMVKALTWVYHQIGRFGGDPSRLTVVGHSAGGQLAAMLMACQWPAYSAGLPADLVKNALSISGLHDMEPIMHAPFLQSSLHLTDKQVSMTSPARLPRPIKGCLYSVAGADESAEFHRQNQLIQSSWGINCVPVCELIPERNHFSVLEDLAMPWTRLHRLASELVFGKGGR